MQGTDVTLTSCHVFVTTVPAIRVAVAELFERYTLGGINASELFLGANIRYVATDFVATVKAVLKPVATVFTGYASPVRTPEAGNRTPGE